MTSDPAWSPRLLRLGTERLLQVAALAAILWFGWQLTATTVVMILQLQQRAAAAESRLAACEAGKKPPPSGN